MLCQRRRSWRAEPRPAQTKKSPPADKTISRATSQAKDIRAAVGSRYGDVLPADGHLFDLLEPEDVLDNRGWCHPYAADGRRRDFDDIPSTVSDLVDDPYRSLAGELRQAGGFAKDVTPFSEFIWADFLRHRIKPKEVKADFSSALAMALKLARSQDADYLPGWCGPSKVV
jgi:hypothetical protein